MGFIKGLGRARDKFIRGSIYKDAIKPMIMQNLLAAANPSTPMGGSGRYYRKRRKSYKGRGMYTGMGMYTGQGAYKYPTYKGRGRYTPAANAIVSYGASSSSKSDPNIVPMFNAVNKDTVMMSRREYVAEIYGPPLIPGTNVCESFALQSFSINPGLEKSFRWLSQIAQNFDEYEMVQCIYTFKSTTTESGNQSNGQVGTVIMATNYNAASPVFREKNTMMQYAGSVSSRLTETCIHGVECDPKLLSGARGEYIRTNPVITNQDIKTYDHGLFQIAIANCVGNLANQSLGELWVSYTVKLRKPKFFTALGLGITKDIFKRNTSNQGVVTSQGPLFNSNYLNGQQNNLGCKLEDLTNLASPYSTRIALLTGPSIGTLNPLTASLLAGPGFRLTFPASYSGFIKIHFTVESDPGVGNLNSGAFSPVSFAPQPYGNGVAYLWGGTGNVRFVPDLYGCYDGSNEEGSNLPTPLFSTGVVRSNSSSATAINVGFIIVAHVSIDIATNGIDNSILLWFGQSAASAGNAVADFSAVRDAYLDVAEYNAGFSYTATGIGSSAAPVFVDRSGVITSQL